MEIGQIRHVGLFTATVKQHARFYSEVWGLDQVSETADAVYFRGSSPEPFIFSLHQNNTRGLHHIAYAMADENAVRRCDNDDGASGEIDRPVEQLKPMNWLIRNVRTGANKWASSASPEGRR